MTPAELADAVLAAAAEALADRCLDTSVLPAAATVQRPRNPDHGDYASTLALQVARRAGLPAEELARAMLAACGPSPPASATTRTRRWRFSSGSW